MAGECGRPRTVTRLTSRQNSGSTKGRTATPGWLAQLAGNTILERYLVELLSRCSLIVALYESPGNAICEHDEHAALVECIARRDGDGAARLMDEHLQALEKNVELRQMEAAPSLGRMLGVG